METDSALVPSIPEERCSAEFDLHGDLLSADSRPRTPHVQGYEHAGRTCVAAEDVLSHANVVQLAPHHTQEEANAGCEARFGQAC